MPLIAVRVFCIMFQRSSVLPTINVMDSPPAAGLIREARGFLELPRLLFRSIDLLLQQRGEGRPVLVLPGYGAGDGSTVILKSYLRLLGYRVSGWHLGRNLGSVPEVVPRVLKRLLSMHRKSQHRVNIIGWSLGGFIARELARDRPELIQRVITLGTPVIGGPKYTVLAESFRRRGIDLDAMEAEIAVRNKIPLQRPVTAIYSRRDAIVAWQACIDPDDCNSEHVEVFTTHLGFGFSPEVFKIIAQRLATACPEPGITKSDSVGLSMEHRRERHGSTS
jgi:pimeloyl-ACP methyl ester carboxylesterase